MTLSIYRAVPSQAELNDLETRVAHILGWQAGTVEIRETIREFRSGQRPYDRYRKETIDKLTQVISPTQGVRPKVVRTHNKIPRIGGR